MSLLDFILNLAALLLWVNWRGVASTATASATGVGLGRAPVPRARGRYLVGLLVLLVARAVFYWQAGPSLGWTPGLSLGPTQLFLRSDHLSRMLLFSGLSFAATLGVFYLFLLVLSTLPGAGAEPAAGASLARRHLGPLGRWPALVKWLLPLVVMTAGWCLLNPLLLRIHLVPVVSRWELLAQGALIGLAVYLALKFLIMGCLLLHLLNSYIYLGDSAFWSFVNATSRTMLRPLQALPLRVGRVDLAPALALAVVGVGAELGRRGLDRIYPLI